MNDNPLTLNLPDELYDRLRQIAEETDRPLEEVVLETLTLTFGHEDEELESNTLDSLSDEHLWSIVTRRLSWNESLRLNELLLKGNQGILSPEDKRELDSLGNRSDRYMLLRSKALSLLHERGHDVSAYFRR